MTVYECLRCSFPHSEGFPHTCAQVDAWRPRRRMTDRVTLVACTLLSERNGARVAEYAEKFDTAPWRASLRYAAAIEPFFEQLEAKCDSMREALGPFATFAETFVDAEGWTGPMNQERIVDWFGPSDFRSAAALTQEGQG